jgi:hypothetical protein
MPSREAKLALFGALAAAGVCVVQWFRRKKKEGSATKGICVYMCMWVYVYACVCVFVCVQPLCRVRECILSIVRMHIHTYMHIHMYIYAHTHVHTHTYVYTMHSR